AVRAPPRAGDAAPGRHRRGARDRQALLDAEVLPVHQRDPRRGAQGQEGRGPSRPVNDLLPEAPPALRAAPASGAAFSRRAVAPTVLLLATLAAAAALPAGADEIAVYRAIGASAGLFDHYDNDGYSLAVARAADGTLELSVRVSGAALASRAPYRPPAVRDAALPP